MALPNATVIAADLRYDKANKLAFRRSKRDDFKP
jgi:hypothetical protein